MNGRSGIVTLTTDFGEGVYVAQMKGVILAAFPQARIVDLWHSVDAQDVAQAAFVVAHAAPLYPIGTVHCAVVDPGVGTARRIICVESAGELYVVPDNGLLTLVLQAAEARGEAGRAWSVTNEGFFRQPVSATFHGRDVFAPVAAALAAGENPAALGPAIETQSIVRLPLAQPSIGRSSIEGSVVFADRFGNLVTNISAEVLSKLAESALGAGVAVFCQSLAIGPVRRTYSDVEEGEILALIGSFDSVEIAVSGGNAAEELGMGPGAKIAIRKV